MFVLGRQQVAVEARPAVDGVARAAADDRGVPKHAAAQAAQQLGLGRLDKEFDVESAVGERERRAVRRGHFAARACGGRGCPDA